MNIEPLKYTEDYKENAPSFLLYECEHVTANTYPLETVIPIGERANLILCKHCWQHVTGMVTEEILKEMMRPHIAKMMRL